MTAERDAFERLIQLQALPPTDNFLSSKAKECWYSTTLKTVLKERDQQQMSSPKQAKPSGQSSYTQLVSAALDAVISGDQDVAMRLRAELMGQFRRKDEQVEAALFKDYVTRQCGSEMALEPECVDLSRLGGMDFLVDGFVPANDQTHVYGVAGCGKTTAALEMAFAVVAGTGYLDHSHPARPASVLFIASDSGAVPLKAALQEMGLDDHEALKTSSATRFYVWASEQSQGTTAWAADLRGCIRLQRFVEQHRIGLVVIDSCKAVCSAAGLDYQNNQLVTELLTFFKKVICPHTTVVWLNHDGTGKDAVAGAKAWKEVPSAVHQITKDDTSNRRTWHARKMRVGQERNFDFGLQDGRLVLLNGAKPTGKCADQIVTALQDAYMRGKEWMKKAELRELICVPGGPLPKTLDNTLSTESRSKHPPFTPVRGRAGCYRLAGRLIPLSKPHTINGKEEGEIHDQQRDLGTSRQVPMGSQGNPRVSHGKVSGTGEKPAVATDLESFLPKWM
jgi:ATP:corrinoid adenosyltransferase